MLLSISVPDYRNDTDGTDTGVNANEVTLNPVNVVTNSFAKQFSTSVDGQVLAQPLFMAGMTITAPGTTGTQNLVYTAPGSAGVHNVAFVATEHDSLYAIDATSGAVLWQDSFINGTTITTVPSADVSSGDISPEIGITGTPAIDTTTGYLYVVAKTKQFENGDTVDPHYVNTLYKVNTQNGTDSSVVIADTTYSGGSFTYNSGPYVLGTGSGAINVGGQERVYFNSLRQMFRPAVVITGGQVVLGSASHGDNGPYHGWMLTYNESTLALTGVLNTTPNGGLGGIWQGGSPIAVDSQGYFYFETGNGSFNQTPSNFPADAANPAGDTSLLPIDGDYGDSFVKVAIDPTTTQSNMNVNGWGLKVVDYFTPEDQNALNSADEDLGSGGPIVLPTSVGSAAHPNLLIGGGKEGKIYLIDRNHMGGFSSTDAGAVQTIGGAVGGILSAPAYYNGEIYYTAGYNGGISAYSISNGALSTSAVSTTPDSFGNLDGGPMISSDGSVNGIVWALERGTGQLRAYNASNLTKELYTSAQAANNADAVGVVMKYTTPLVANGQVFVGTSNSLVVYGLPIVPTVVPAAPTNLVVTAPVASEITLNWTDNSTNEAAFNIQRSTDDKNWTQIGAVGANVTTYNDTTVQSLTTYYYQVQASNVIGVSAFTNVASATTPGAQSIGTGDGLLGQYYPGNNVNFATSTPTATRVDPTINFNWSTTGPIAALGNVNYSVRWTGQLQAQYSQAYTFSTTSDDGIQVFLNGQTIISDYTDHASTTDTSLPINLMAGQNYTIEVDYFQAGGLAVASLSWSSPSTTKQIIPQTQLFSGTAPVAPVLATPVAASGTQINLSWTESSVNETGFEIDRAVGAAGVYSLVAVVAPATTSYMDSSLIPNTNYYYQVRALNFAANSPFSNQVNLTTPVPPATPSNGQPTRITTNEIDLSWTNNAADATVTRILRNSGAGGNFVFVAAVSPSTTTYHDLGPNGAGLTPGVSYDYHIQVANVAGYSDFTGFVVQTLTTAPTQLNAVSANGQVTLAWKAPNGALSYNVYRATTSGGEGATPLVKGITSNTYVDTSVTNGTTYYYEVTAVDTGGESAVSAESSATPQVATALSPPPGGLVTSIGDGQATLNWSPASGATAYNIYRGTASGGETLVKTGVAATTFVDTGLTDGTKYYYQVTSVNALGEGARSSEVTAIPQIVTPLTPINVQATPADGQVSLSWSPASDALSYNIYRATDSGDEVLYQQGVPGTSFVDTGVSDGNTYYYQISAANGVGESNLSNEVSATPLPPLPATPTSFTATAINDAQIQLQWKESSTALTGFTLERSVSGGSYSPLTTLDPGVTSYVDSSGLLQGVTYSYQIVATNLAGNSAPSSTASAALLAQLSSPWADTDIGSPSPAGSAFFSQNILTVAGSGVDSGSTSDQLHYVYQALNGNGTIIAQVLSQGNSNSLAKAGVMIRNTLAAGSAFADMVLTASGGAIFQSRTTANAASTSTVLTGYAAPDWVELTRSGTTFTGYVSTNGVNWTLVGSATISLNTQVDIGLAVNSNVPGSLNTAVIHAISVNSQSTPAAPTKLSPQILSGDSASLTWTNNDTSNFGDNVYRENPGSSTFVLLASLPSNATSFTDTGLISGDSYSYYVTATNTVGASPASNTVLITLPLLPIAPSNLQSNQITTTSAGLNWQLNSSNDTGVYVYRSTGSTNVFSLIATLPAGTVAYPDNTLQSGTLYQYEVAAFNPAGQSSVAVTGLTTLPAAPTGLGANSNNGQINLSWTAPVGALAFNVYRGLAPGAEDASAYASGVNTTSFVDKGANSGTTYYYTVTAVDFSGQSTASNETSAALSASSAPAAPSALAGQAASATSVVLTWSANSATQTGYQLDRATNSAFTQNLITLTLPATPAMYTDTAAGLAAGGTYYYRLRATNGGGASGNSNLATVPIPALPSAATNAAVTKVLTGEIDLSWTDNAGSSATGYTIQRSVAGGSFTNYLSLAPASAAAPSTMTLADTNVTPGTLYDYHILPSNISGSSPYLDISATSLTAAPSGLTPTAGASAIGLSWTAPTGAVTYNVYRGTTSGAETLLVSGIATTTYSDAAVTAGTTYYYKVTAVNANATRVPPLTSESAASGEASSALSSAVVNFPSGFTSTTGLMFNGSAKPSGTYLQLTDGGASEAGSVFTTTPIAIGGFSTTFSLLVPANASSADGSTFTIQGVGPTALGAIGSGLGYGTNYAVGSSIGNSLAIKFDLFNNSGEGNDSTGLYTNGATPTLANSLSLTASGINLHAGDPLTVTLSYSGTTLTETITDPVTAATFSTQYTVNIASLVGAQTAYVGFTGGTGGATAIQDIQTWTFTPTVAIPAPAAPSALAGQAASATSVVLTWSANSATQTGYQLDRATNSAFTQNLITLTLPATPAMYTDTAAGLAAGGTYYYRLRATNGGGASGNSNLATVPIPALPSAATNAAVTKVLTGEIDLSWTDNAGSSATGYTIQRSVAGGPFTNYLSLAPASAAAPSTMTLADTNVTPGTLYDYHILPSNISGSSPYLDISATSLTAAPSGLTPTVSTSGIGLSWTAPAGAVTYNVYRGTTTGGETLLVSGIATTTYSDTTVTAGTTYYYKVTAVNANATRVPPLTSESAASSEVSATPLTAAPTGLTPTVSTSGIGLSWTAPTGAVTYNVYRGTTSGGETLLVSGVATTTYSDTTVTAGTTYYYKVTAVNANATHVPPLTSESAASGEVSATPLTAAPSGLTPTAGASAIGLSWTAPAGAVTYNVYRGTTTGGETLLVSGIATTTYSDAAVTAGTTYYYKVTAVNANATRVPPLTSESAASSEVSATSLTAAPSGLTPTVSTSGIGLSWTAPTGAVTYNVYRGTTSGGETLLVSGVATTTYSDTTVAAGTTYYYKVTAVNANATHVPPLTSESAASSEVSATSLTAAPSGLTPTAGASAIGLSWTAPTGAVTYNVYRGTTSGAETLLVSGIATTTYSDAAVTAGTTYYYKVTAVNANATRVPPLTSESAASGEVSSALSSAVVNFPSGFTSTTGLMFNGSAKPSGTYLQLTDGGASEAGSVFTTTPIAIGGFSTTFSLLVPANASSADGSTFTIQGVGPTALGAIGSGLGYGTNYAVGSSIGNSLAIKFDLFNNSGEGNDSTGLYTNGATPTLANSLSLTASGINLHAGDPLTVTLSYSGTTLTETITDPVTAATFSTQYTVNIASLVGAQTAYVGFTGGTGGATAIQDIQTWTFTPTVAIPAPAAPSALAGQAASATSVVLTWSANSATQTGYQLDRATNSAFTQNLITLTLPATPAMYTDTAAGLAAGGTYYYRLRTTNGGGASGNSNLATVPIPALPSAATNAAVTKVLTGEIDLSWTDNAGSSATGYTIQRSVAGGPFTNYLSLAPASAAAPSTMTLADTNVTPGTLYDYHILPSNISGSSPYLDISATSLTAAPSGLTPTVSTSGIGLSWTAPAGAVTYNVYRGTTTGGETLLVSGIATTTYSDAAVTAGTTYYYKVTAVNANATRVPPLTSESAASGEVSATPLTAAPTGLTPTVSTSGIGLSWTAPTGAMTYNVYRGTTSGGETLLVSGVATTTYSDTTVTAGTTYYYRVTAVNANATHVPPLTSESAASSEVSATSLTAAPSGLTPTAGASAIGLSWTAPTGAVTYKVYRGTTSGGETLLVSGIATTTYSDAAVTAGTTYYYKVTAVNANATRVPPLTSESAASGEASSALSSAVVNFPSGFTSTTGLMFNGSAKPSGTYLQLTDGGASEAGSVFTTTPIAIGGFSTTFSLLVPANASSADGSTFTIQGVGPTALGAIGSGLGYGTNYAVGSSIGNSLAIKFDLFNNSGEGNDSTGLYTNGATPTVLNSVSLTASGINLHAGDPLTVTLSYSGTTLTETITDPVTAATFSTQYTVNIASLVGADGLCRLHRRHWRRDRHPGHPDLDLYPHGGDTGRSEGGRSRGVGKPRYQGHDRLAKRGGPGIVFAFLDSFRNEHQVDHFRPQCAECGYDDGHSLDDN